MARPGRGDVEMDIEEVMGLIAPQKEPAQILIANRRHIPTTSFAPPEEDDLYDPLAGDSPDSTPVASGLEKGQPAQAAGQERASADISRVVRITPPVAEEVRLSAHNREISQEPGGYLGKSEGDKRPPLAGLLEYADEESEGEELDAAAAQDVASIEADRVVGAKREAANVGPQEVERSSFETVTAMGDPPDMHSEGWKREGFSAKEHVERKVDERRDRDAQRDGGRQRDGGEASNREERERNERRGGGQNRRREDQYGGVRPRQSDGHKNERETDRGNEPGRHRRDRGDRERGGGRPHEGGHGRERERERGDRRRDDAAFRGGNRDAREHGREYGAGRERPGGRGPRTEHEPRSRHDQDSRSRHVDPRDRARTRSPESESRRDRPTSRPAPKPDAKPVSKPGPASKEGSTGADVDLGAAVAAAAAAAARSAKLAASRAPPPPADPAEAAARAAEMVNKTHMIQNAVLQQKRKMLWGDKKAPTEEAATGGTNRWDAVAVGDTERTHKFQKLMGLKGAAPLSPPKPTEAPAVMTAEKQQQVQAELERQYAAGLRRRDGRTVGLGL